MSGDLRAARPRLLVVLPASVMGGAETRTFNLLKGLAAFDRVLLTQAAIADVYSSLDIRIERFDALGCATPYRLDLKNVLRYARAIGRVARRERPDVMLALMHNGTLFASAAHDLHCRRTPVIGTVLGNLSAYFEAESRTPTLWERLIIRYFLSRPKTIVTPSRGVRDDLVARFGGQLERLQVIYNGVDLQRCRERASAGSPTIEKDRPWIVTACRMDPQKDFPTLLRAFDDVCRERPTRLILVGDGQRRGEIVRIAEELGITSEISLVGFQPNPFPWIAAADVFVLSSSYEGFGNVIVEAMALGVPVVASDCPSGPAEIIEHAVSGFLVPVGDSRAMADRCLELLANRERRAAVVQAGLLRAEQFGVAAMVEAFDKLLHAAIAN